MRIAFRKYLLGGVVIPAAGYLAVDYTLLNPPSISPLAELGIDSATFNPDTISPKLAKRLGLRTKRPATELVAVVISAENCVGNRHPGFHEAVSALPGLLQQQIMARPDDVVTRIVGVALDEDAEVGSKYLRRLTRFDEIIAGGGWLNTATEQFFWGSSPSLARIPQVILLERTVTWSDPSMPAVGKPRVLSTFVGAAAIVDWVQQGAPTEASSTLLPPLTGGPPPS